MRHLSILVCATLAPDHRCLPADVTAVCTALPFCAPLQALLDSLKAARANVNETMHEKFDINKYVDVAGMQQSMAELAATVDMPKINVVESIKKAIEVRSCGDYCLIVEQKLQKSPCWAMLSRCAVGLKRGSVGANVLDKPAAAVAMLPIKYTLHKINSESINQICQYILAAA